MIGIIIAGGFGTRMQPLTYTRPKHVLPVANRPFLEYQVALLRRHGVRRIVFATGYHADQIEAKFGNGAPLGVEMVYARETSPLGTGGAIRNAWQASPEDLAIVLNGDILTDFDLGALMAFHAARAADATIALRPVGRPNPFGVLEVRPDGRVDAWREPDEAAKKRASAQAPGDIADGYDLINAGIYVLTRDVIAAIAEGRAVSIERETYPTLIDGGAAVFGSAPEGYWLDVGSPASYLAANVAVLSGAVHTDVPFRAVAPDAEVHPDADIDTVTSIGARCVVGAGARLTGSIMLDDVTVGARAALVRCIAEERVAIGDDAAVEGAVLASGTVLARGTRACG